MEQKKLFVGNLPYGTTIETLVELFLKYGNVVDSYKAEGKGFGFITFETEEQAANALEALNGMNVEGREIVVSIARPREDKPRRSFGDRGGYNRGGNDRRGGDRGGYNRDRY